MDQSLEDMLAQLQAQYGGDPADTTVAPAEPTFPDPNATPAGYLPDAQPPSAPAAPAPSPYQVATATRESGNNPTAQNPNSTASGTNQFLDGTYQDMVNRHPDRNYQGKNDPRLMADFTQENTQALRLGLGRAPTSMDVYAAHFLGATGAVKFLTAPPNTPVTQVVSPEAINSNHNVFFDKTTGQPLTVGQVYNSISQNMGFKDTIPMNPQGGVPGGGQAATPAAAQTPGDALYGQQKQDISNYIAGQPAMWAKLADLQNQYKQAAQPTSMDKISDAMSQFQQQQAVAQANSHATAGGILNHELPSATAFNQALEASHTIDTDARTARLNQAQQAYQMDSGALQAQNSQNATNLGLTGALAKETGEYNLNSGTNALKLAQFNLDQQKAVGEQIEKLVPNPETRAIVSAQYDAQHNPQGGYQANMKILNGIIQRVQAGTPGVAGSDGVQTSPAVPGMQISAKEPAKMMSITTFDPTANNGAGGQKLETVNAATPEGQQRLKAVAISDPTAKITDLAAPVNNVSVGGAGEGSGTAGAGSGAGLAAQHQAAGETKQAAQAALQLLPFIEANGGTGVLTDSPQGKVVASAIKQATGFDPAGLPVREVYDKLMQQVQNGLTTPGLKAFGGRPAAAEFKILQAGQLGATATTQAAHAFLSHVAETMDYTQNKLEAQSNAQMKARQTNNTYFDPDNWAIQFQKNNLPPVWHGQDLLDAVQGTPTKGPTDVSPPLALPTPAINWLKEQLKLPGSSSSTPTAPVPPAAPRHTMPSPWEATNNG